MDDADRAADIRARANRIREQARRLRARADGLAPGPMRDMLTSQAAILAKGADDLDVQALAMAPPAGTA